MYNSYEGGSSEKDDDEYELDGYTNEDSDLEDLNDSKLEDEDDEDSYLEYETPGKDKRPCHNSIEEVARNEYTSILFAFNLSYLIPITENKTTSNEVFDEIKSRLEETISDPQFKDLSFRLKNAYFRIDKLVNTIGMEGRAILGYQKDVLNAIVELGYSCKEHEDEIAYMNGRDPCRIAKMNLLRAIGESEAELGITSMSKRARGMLETCKECPHKYRTA